MLEILPHRVRCALVPTRFLVETLLRRENVHKPAGESIEFVSLLNVAVEGSGVELGQEINFTDLAIQTIADGNIHKPVFSGEGNCGFRPVFGEGKKTGALPPAHDHRQYLVHLEDFFLGRHRLLL